MIAGCMEHGVLPFNLSLVCLLFIVCVTQENDVDKHKRACKPSIAKRRYKATPMSALFLCLRRQSHDK